MRENMCSEIYVETNDVNIGIDNSFIFIKSSGIFRMQLLNDENKQATGVEIFSILNTHKKS
jgi:hypothetical protein